MNHNKKWLLDTATFYKRMSMFAPTFGFTDISIIFASAFADKSFTGKTY